MQFHDYITLVQRVDSLIKTKSTGSPKQMAQRLGISERSWYYLLNQLRSEFGIPIAFSRFRCSYYYPDDASHWDDFLKIFMALPNSKITEK
ncbi:hypothetical protein FHS57_006427 [Runella defluvii]|uniref:HTH domain-containing protein n=1 Tax=Runella defluvii TaxID=370973 RepID=A0A7W5ZUM0_9BACT|nr:hypothetical protein [Runella defluvii]MBB3842396.1 hypothetical protein [Runella defluvii]